MTLRRGQSRRRAIVDRTRVAQFERDYIDTPVAFNKTPLDLHNRRGQGGGGRNGEQAARA